MGHSRGLRRIDASDGVIRSRHTGRRCLKFGVSILDVSWPMNRNETWAALRPRIVRRHCASRRSRNSRCPTRLRRTHHRPLRSAVDRERRLGRCWRTPGRCGRYMRRMVNRQGPRRCVQPLHLAFPDGGCDMTDAHRLNRLMGHSHHLLATDTFIDNRCLVNDRVVIHRPAVQEYSVNLTRGNAKALRIAVLEMAVRHKRVNGL